MLGRIVISKHALLADLGKFDILQIPISLVPEKSVILFIF